ncbi:histidine phosphatase family protein [Enterovibrio coralii]|uniref:Phosphoglycerate mutase n=1 Tax=Enterovibrio coralii TaxID=294935 RepID=A0A135ICK0_9GAMM|nr:histidine phosphatase family protein [Enterovibrio coralii]KXF83145.1 phosphoglycerate mutase [Enterovibrio coralii]
MKEFNNTYLIMRHGQSEANVADIVVSDPANGCSKYGLSEMGKHQAREAALAVSNQNVDLIYCSDFKRTKETADIVAQVLSVEPVTDARLRERFFGQYEGKSSASYDEVWKKDALDSDQTEMGVESTTSVRRRAVAFVAELEQLFFGKVILLVSHGDTLQILSSAFHDIESGQHRTLPHHETGEVKTLAKAGSSKNREFTL